EALQAFCACSTVRFHITRPNAASLLPHSNFPDLMYPDGSTDDSIKGNPSGVKWWVPGGRAKYLAGTCACRSCRLASGFEIQAWAFVPRSNIFFQVPGPNDSQVIPLNFDTLPPGILRSYASSPEVLREFCGGCGATVFWHDRSRPDVIDVSVGLLDAEEGARAENWVESWTKRGSFSEVETARTGAASRTARDLITSPEKGMK
ncbi:Mss4-like protein, partial [Ilyonectria sp. MPI-CAGE-AT-0026]